MAEDASCVPGLRVCASADLQEAGAAVSFRVRYFREELNAFALRFGGRVVAYLNRCLHVPVEMDWQPGEFLDSTRRIIICSIHGAGYDPRDGRCLGGPCGRGRLVSVRVEETEGQVYWYPSKDVSPVA